MNITLIHSLLKCLLNKKNQHFLKRSSEISSWLKWKHINEILIENEYSGYSISSSCGVTREVKYIFLLKKKGFFGVLFKTYILIKTEVQRVFPDFLINLFGHIQFQPKG